MIALDSINLPEDLWWADETDWTPVVQETGYSTAGALLVDISVKQAGRPVTLVGDDNSGWISRATVLALMDLAADPGRQMPLTFHNRAFTVIFSHQGKPIDVEPVFQVSQPEDSDDYILKAIRLMAV